MEDESHSCVSSSPPASGHTPGAWSPPPLPTVCGISGYLSLAGQRADAGIIRRMTATLRHRGPDDEGFYVEGPVALGHRRLRIIDLETGRQPIANETGSVRVILNGEIYNFRELRARLRERGHRFATRSDTGVIVHAWETGRSVT